MVGHKLGAEAMKAGSGNPVPDIATAIAGYVAAYRSSPWGQARLNATGELPMVTPRPRRNGKAVR